MAWIKRNLIFVIVAAVAVAFLAGACIYIFKNLQRNDAALATLNETYSTLQQLNHEPILPGNDKVDNTRAAREQQAETADWVGQSAKFFQAIAPIPGATDGPVTSERFAAALRRTIDQLQRDAAGASVSLPPQYNFSFEAERSLVKFAQAGLGPLSVQLGEVKEISETLFEAKINSLDNLRRVRVSDDDTAGPQSDYLDELVMTNNLAIFTPYQITFRCFSQDVANVLLHFASSPHGFILKGINVLPAGSVATAATASPEMERRGGVPPSQPYMQQPGAPYGAAPSAPMMRGGTQTVLNEQLLNVTIEVELVKLLPKK